MPCHRCLSPAPLPMCCKESAYPSQTVLHFCTDLKISFFRICAFVISFPPLLFRKSSCHELTYGLTVLLYTTASRVATLSSQNCKFILREREPPSLILPSTNRYFTVISSLCQFSFVNISYKTQTIFLCKLTIQGRFKVSFIRLPPAAFRRFPSLEAKKRSTLPCFPAPPFP